jgi:hypothetical protein
MVMLVHNGETETILEDNNNKIILFNSKDDALSWKSKGKMDIISKKHREVIGTLNEVEPCVCMEKIEELPTFLYSQYEIGSMDGAVIDGATGEVFSNKHKIVFCDADAGYFVERIGTNLIAKKNQFVLHRNNNLEIVKA